MLTAVVQESLISAAIAQFKTNIGSSASRERRTLESPGGATPVRLYWQEEAGVWVGILPDAENGRYWIAVGNDLGDGTKNLRIPVEINPPVAGVNRRLSGLIVRDEAGRYYLAHAGGLRGGKYNVSKEEFAAAFMGSASTSVAFPDGKVADYYIISCLDDERLPHHLSRFAKEAIRIRALKREAKIPAPPDPDLSPHFTSEFSGKKKVRGREAMEVNCEHGAIVDALRSRLAELGYEAWNRGFEKTSPDIFTTAGSKGECLFEVKTGNDTSDTYAAIGQLLVYGHARDRLPALYLVMPDQPANQACRNALKSLQMKIIQYERAGSTYRFPTISKYFPPL